MLTTFVCNKSPRCRIGMLIPGKVFISLMHKGSISIPEPVMAPAHCLVATEPSMTIPTGGTRG